MGASTAYVSSSPPVLTLEAGRVLPIAVFRCSHNLHTILLQKMDAPDNIVLHNARHASYYEVLTKYFQLPQYILQGQGAWADSPMWSALLRIKYQSRVKESKQLPTDGIMLCTMAKAA